MNENPIGTPNPLNQNPLDANPAEPMQAAQPMGQPSMRTVRPLRRPVAQNAQSISAGPAAPAANTNGMNTVVESLDPTGRPMEQEPVFVDKPKKKTGLIVGLVTCAALLICGGIAAAIVLLNMPKTDAVSAAMNKIMSGEAPTNVAVEGSIEMRSNDDNSPVEMIRIDLDSGIERNSLVNTSSAVVTLSIKDKEDISFEFDEVYAESGDLYLKLDGVTNALEDSGLLEILSSPQPIEQPLEQPEVVDCMADGDETDCVAETMEPAEPNPGIAPVENCDDEDGCTPADVEVTMGGAEMMLDSDLMESLSMILGVVDTVDGEWLRISASDFDTLSPGADLKNSPVSCITNLVADIDTTSSSAADLYNNYPFVTSSSENITLAQKNDPIYAVSIDSENFANFVNAIDNTKLSADIYDCLGWTNNASVAAADVEAVVDGFPAIYAEVDEDNNFTRLYLESDSLSAGMTTIIDLTFKYPDSFNINEPNEYTDFSDLLQEIFSSMYNLPESENDVIIEE